MTPLKVKPGRGRGRPRKEGRRVHGRLQSGPNEALLEKRRQITANVAMATNPLDAAFANGWITEAQHRAGASYALIWRRSGIGAHGPANRSADYGEAPESRGELRGVPIREMASHEIEALWEACFGERAPDSPDEREKEQAAAMIKWRAVNAALSQSARAEMFSFCVMEAWPEWFCFRLALKNLKARIVELDAKKGAAWGPAIAILEEKHDELYGQWDRHDRARAILRRNLDVVAEVMKSLAPHRAGPRRPRKLRAPEIGPRIIETSDYVDAETGDVLLTVERRGR